MNRKWVVLLALCCTHPAMAQDPGWSWSVGVRGWFADWTTFGYVPDPNNPNNSLALAEVSAEQEVAPLPIVSVRYRDFFGSITGFMSTDFSLDDGTTNTREEYDINVGYYVMPGLAFTLGYKKVEQSFGDASYRPAGPVVGLSANAPLEGAWSLYGNLGVGWLQTPGGDAIQFDADYSLAELGLAYTLSTDGLPRAWTFTAGYRVQILTSKEAFGTQDGRDTTMGFTIGAMATF